MYNIGHTISANAPFLFWNNDVIALPQENPQQADVVVIEHSIVCFIFYGDWETQFQWLVTKNPRRNNTDVMLSLQERKLKTTKALLSRPVIWGRTTTDAHSTTHVSVPKRLQITSFCPDWSASGLLWSAWPRSENHRKGDPEVKHRHGCAVWRRDVRQTPDVCLQPHVLGESAVRRCIIV